MSDELREAIGAASDEITEQPEGLESQSPGSEAPALEPLSPHEHWPQTVKERFGKADRDWQQFLLDREKQYSQGVTSLTSKYQPLHKNWSRFQEVISPHRRTFQMMGLDDIGAIQYLTNLHAAIQSNPQQGLSWLAQRFGVDLNQLATHGQGQGSPEVQALQQQIQAMQQQLKQFGTQYSTTQMQTLEAQVGEWSQAKDEKGQPRYPFLEDVVDEIVTYIRGKRAAGQPVTVQALDGIYDRAVHANPVTRAKLGEASARQADETRKRKADEARRAGFDVKGQGGAKLAPNRDNLRADLEAAWPSS